MIQFGKIGSAATVGLAILVWGCAQPVMASAAGLQQIEENSEKDAMLALLESKVASNPEHADSWRLLGRLHRQRGELDEAEECLARAIELDPRNVAAHYNLGELYLDREDPAQAAAHFARVFSLGPGSEYAAQLVAMGIHPPPGTEVIPLMPPLESDPFEATVPVTDEEGEGPEQTEFEIETFDSSDDFSDRLEQLPEEDERSRFLDLGLDTGVLYNSNVTLTPISRSLANIDAASAQFFANPSLEWTVVEKECGRYGPLARGYFTINEGNHSNFNLSSYQVGAWFEKDLTPGPARRTARLDYTWGQDWFSSDLLGDRHLVTASLLTIVPASHIDYVYASTALSWFADDGAVPGINSFDGTTWSAGAARFFLTGRVCMPTWTLGTDVEYANTEGDDYRYQSARVYSDVMFSLTERISLTPNAAIGFRYYPDFTGAVDRDELTGRLGAKLKYEIFPDASISGVLNYDRFASDNEQFDVDRLTTGIITSFRY
jgi:tetratricopeptide (TPR) repeat protein